MVVTNYAMVLFVQVPNNANMVKRYREPLFPKSNFTQFVPLIFLNMHQLPESADPRKDTGLIYYIVF